jgi:UDP-glucose 4-epimerase
MSKTTVLVTGATGYIASHTIVELLGEGYEVIGIDNLVNSKKTVISRITSLADKSLIFRNVDIRDYNELDRLFETYSIQSVIHFAGYKAVGESMEKPMMYYSNNLKGSITLFEVMEKHDVKNLVFSSSCTVYGNEGGSPIKETNVLNPTNPYGRTKFYIENALKDICAADPTWTITALRYFNPIGAHESGEIGEDPTGIPNNLLPYIAQVASGKREKLSIFGGDYNTPDGTCIRDNIHVNDIALGHIAALESITTKGFDAINLGTGVGYSVLDVVKTFEKVSGIDIPYIIVDRRPGDAEAVWADPTSAYKKLYWKAKYDLEKMCADTWYWQLKNPNGFNSHIHQHTSSDKKVSLSIDGQSSTKSSLKAKITA